MIIKLAKLIEIDTAHLKKDDKELLRIKKTVNEMLKDDKEAKK